MLAKFISIAGGVAAALLLFFVTTTTPIESGPLGILVVFLCLYVMLLSLITLVLWILHRFIRRLAGVLVLRRPLSPLSLQRSYYFSSVIALAPVILLGLQSVGGAGVYETTLVFIFVAIGCIYIAKRTA